MATTITAYAGGAAASTITGAMIAANTVATAALSKDTIQYAEVSMTSAEVKALRATPKTLVAAPGAGLVLEYLSMVLLVDYGGTNGWTESTNNLAVKYENGSGTAVTGTIEMTGFIDQTADTMTTSIYKIDTIAAKTACENKALVLHNTSGAEIGGNAANDNVLRAKIAYRVHSTGW